MYITGKNGVGRVYLKGLQKIYVSCIDNNNKIQIYLTKNKLTFMNFDIYGWSLFFLVNRHTCKNKNT